MSKRIYVRPSKTQSKAGFVVGIIFCLLGLFVVIPIFGFFGIFWTAIAGWITYVNYRNGFTDRQISSRVVEVEEDKDRVTVTSHTGFETYAFHTEEDLSQREDVEVRMKKIQSLYDQALVTREEYEKKRKEILEKV